MSAQTDVHKLRGEAQEEAHEKVVMNMKAHHSLMQRGAERIRGGIRELVKVLNEVEVEIDCLPRECEAKTSLQEWMQRSAEGKEIIRKILSCTAFQSNGRVPGQLRVIVDAAGDDAPEGSSYSGV